jgi:hypothetical protein
MSGTSTRSWALILVLAAGCTDGGADEGAGGSGGSSGTGGAGGSLPTPTKPPDGAPPFVVGGFSVQLPDYQLSPGAEEYPCWIAPLENDGASRVVGGASMTVTGGMHHGNVTARPRTGEGFRPCPEEEDVLAGEAGDVLAGGAVLFGSTTQFEGTEWRSFPPGMGYRIGGDWEIVFRMHYLNTTPEPVTLAPRYDWYTIDEAEVTQLLAPFIWTYGDFQIPARSEMTVSAECPFQTANNHLVSLMPHMHKLGTRFTASVIGGKHDGEMFLDSPGYNPDGVIVGFDPPLDLSDAAGFRFECTWNNTFDKTIEEGVGDNEMCMLFGYGFPYESSLTAYAAGDNCATLAAPPPGD